MKIGIITFVNEDNYGAVLQAYALQTFINEVTGEKCEFLNINLKQFKKNDKNIFIRFFIFMVFLRKKIAFAKFRKLLDISKKNNTNKKYDILIIGSDQIWNPNLTAGLQPIFFAYPFKCKKIAYACSCGNCNLLIGKEPQLSIYLNSIDYISVREKSLENFLNKFLNKPIITVLDPVFLLNKTTWEHKLINHSQIINKKYIFVYILEENKIITEAVNELSVEQKLDVVTLRTKKHYINEYKRFPNADPKKFLELLYAAEIVVTNSFHALAFSLIFKKKVALFKHSAFNERIENLLEIINSNNVYYSNTKTILDLSIHNETDDFKRIMKISRAFLKKNVNASKYID